MLSQRSHMRGNHLSAIQKGSGLSHSRSSSRQCSPVLGNFQHGTSRSVSRTTCNFSRQISPRRENYYEARDVEASHRPRSCYHDVNDINSTKFRHFSPSFDSVSTLEKTGRQSRVYGGNSRNRETHSVSVDRQRDDFASPRGASGRRSQRCGRSMNGAHASRASTLRQIGSENELLHRSLPRSLERVGSPRHTHVARHRSLARVDSHAVDDRRPTLRQSGTTKPRNASSERISNSNHRHPNLVKSAAMSFCVCIHHFRSKIPNMFASRRTASIYIDLRTMEERAHTAMAQREHNPVFNDEFVFTSSCPDEDLLVLTLMASSSNMKTQAERVAKCALPLRNFKRNKEKSVWVPLVRHPGTPNAYECGKVQVSIFPVDYGAEPLLEAAATHYDDVDDQPVGHSLEKLHNSDWHAGHNSCEGPKTLAQQRDKFATGSAPPVHLSLTVREITNLSMSGDAPVQIDTCYVIISAGGHMKTSKVVHYRHHAVLDQTFEIALRHPERDALTVAVHSTARKLCEAQVGLVNIREGDPKDVTLNLVHASGTKEAANSGQVSLTLCTKNYTSPFQMTAAQERRLREHVLAYIWCYRREDLHLVDFILASMDNEDQYMREWSRSIGPEPLPRHFSINVHCCRNVFVVNTASLADGYGYFGPRRCYVQVSVGPITRKTGLSSVLKGDIPFMASMDITSYMPTHDVVRLLLVEETETCDREVSRVEFGLCLLQRKVATVRRLRLVANASTSTAHAQGEVEVELVAHNFGVTRSEVALEEQSASYLDALESAIKRSNPENLHRVPYIVDTTPAKDRDKVLAGELRKSNSNATAPMMVRILGLKGFQPKCDRCYVESSFHGNLILRTHHRKTMPDFTFDIDDDNEKTIKLFYASNAILCFEVKQHRSFRGSRTIGWAELALGMMSCRGPNTVWLHLFQGSRDNTETSLAVESFSVNKMTDVRLFKGNRMLTAATAAHTNKEPGALLGYLGVMVQSMAFPDTTILDHKAVSSEGLHLSTFEAVTCDVMTFLTKYCPQNLKKAQSLMAQCSSLREAHHELRVKLCPKQVGVTVYINIDKVEMITIDGKAQENRCGIIVDASFAEEHQQSQKRSDLEHDVTYQRAPYPLIRLDIMNPADRLEGEGRSESDDQESVSTSLQLKLIGVRDAEKFATIINNISHSTASTSRGLFSTAACRVVGNADRTFTTNEHEPSLMAHYTPSRASIGGKNNLGKYLDEIPIFSAIHEIKNAQAAAATPYSSSGFQRQYNRVRFAGQFSDSPRYSTNYHGSTSSSLGSFDEIGLVRLSLRALLTHPLYNLGSPVRVPVVSSFTESSPSRADHNPNHRTCRVVGFITLRITVPVFEVVPEWMRLSDLSELVKSNLERVRDYERRIGVYLAEKLPAGLIDFHYRLYERDMISANWRTSLHQWLRALTTRFGSEPTTSNKSRVDISVDRRF